MAIPLILLFVFGTIFQVTDTVDRVRGWFSSESIPILHIQSPVDYLGEDGGMLNRAEGDDEVFHVINLSTLPAKNNELLKSLLGGGEETWLVRFEGTDRMVTELDEDGLKIPTGELIGLHVNLPFVLNVEARDGEGALLIDIHFPNIDASRPWADFESVPSTCCYGTFKHTAFYRFVEYQEKGQLPFQRHFKAQYVEPESDLAKSLLTELKSENYRQYYFETKPAPDNDF